MTDAQFNREATHRIEKLVSWSNKLIRCMSSAVAPLLATLSLLLVLLSTLACAGRRTDVPPGSAAVSLNVANVHAFARLYGVVRWFHPSDAAAAVDWDRFAIEGIRYVVDAPTISVLRMRLLELFGPIAPTIQLIGRDDIFANAHALERHAGAAGDLIAWQHKGYGDSTIATGYVSKRLHRDRVVAIPGALFASLSQAVDATPFRGRRVRFRGKARAGMHGRGQLWLRVERGYATTFFNNMAQNPVIDKTWASAEITGAIDLEATRMVFGVLNMSSGTAWYDNLELSIESQDHQWQRLAIRNADFEEADLLANWNIGIGRSTPPRSLEGWDIAVDDNAPASGRLSLRIGPAMQTVTEELFDATPSPGEVFEVDLGNGLKARIPIALTLRGSSTSGDALTSGHRESKPFQLSRFPDFDVARGMADVIVFWNVFEHFWPYWNTVSVDWAAMLDAALTTAAADRTIDQHVATLEHLGTGAPDGHIGVTCPGETERAYPPFSAELVASQVVVTNSSNPAIKRGDVVLSVDLRSAVQLLAVEESHVSGSPQWQVVGALQRFARGPIGSTMRLQLRRADREVSIAVPRVEQRIVEAPLHSPIERLDDGVYYVDLSRAPMDDIEAAMPNLATAPGVVLDMRGYPRRNHQILSHILARAEELKDWESIPLIIRPDSPAAPAGWKDTSTWNMPRLSVRQPHIGGRVAFVTGPGAISSAETLMALVEYYRLGAIVGATTAGTNGDIAQITMPTGCTAYFTGRRVTKPGGGQHHLVGVQPTIAASRSVEGIQAGRDEVLDAALTYVRAITK